MAEGSGIATIMIFAIVLVLVATTIFFAQRYKRCPPDKIMVVYGRTSKGAASRSIHGGATLVWPLIQDYAFLSLTPITINIDLRNALSMQNIRINVPSTFTVGISTEPAIMTNAAERLLQLSPQQIEEMAKEIIFGQLRLTVASLTIEQINQDRDTFLEMTRTNVDTELQKIGIHLINVNLVDITDESDYIESIGKKAASTAVENARIDVANAERDGAVGAAKANRVREIEVAKTQQKQKKVVRPRKQISVYMLVIKRHQRFLVRTLQRQQSRILMRIQQRVEAAAKQRAAVAAAQAEAEIQRAFFKEEEARLQASEIVREQIQKQQIEISAEAEAERLRRIARGDADAILARYEAEAAGIQKVLDAKASGYAGLVKSAGGDTKAAATLLMVEKVESMVAAQVEAIRNMKIDKVTVWDGGNNADGSSATSNFVSSLVQSLPPIHDVAKMAGVDLPDYLGSLTDDHTN